MRKKIDIEIDVTASGFGKEGRMFSHDHIDKEIEGVKDTFHRKGSAKDIEGRRKVFSGEDFNL